MKPLRDDELELDWGSRGARTPDAAPQPQPEDQRMAGKGRPGDARHMPHAVQLGLEPILQGDSFTVKQIKEWGEILTGWETRNRYEVFDSGARAFLCAGETGEGIGNLLLRNFWMFRSMELEFMTYSGSLVMKLTRPFRWFLRRFEVNAWDGRLMGVLQQRFTFLQRKFDVLTPAGIKLAEIVGPWWRPWTFRVMRGGVEIATIRKHWSGLAKEYFTDADEFGVQLGPSCNDPFLRQLLLAATLAIDLSYFEQKGGRSRGELGIHSLLSD